MFFLANFEDRPRKDAGWHRVQEEVVQVFATMCSSAVHIACDAGTVR